MSDTQPDVTVETPPAAPEPVLLYGCITSDSRGQTVLHPTRENYLATVKAMADDGYMMCVDVTAVDYLEMPDRSLPDGVTAERFEVVTNLLDMVGTPETGARRARLRVQVPADDPEVASLFHVHPGTEAMEREVFDMFGIVFTDHPDLTRILMPEDWVGHPLRKDYAVGAIPVQFKQVGER